MKSEAVDGGIGDAIVGSMEINPDVSRCVDQLRILIGAAHPNGIVLAERAILALEEAGPDGNARYGLLSALAFQLRTMSVPADPACQSFAEAIDDFVQREMRSLEDAS